MGRSNEGGFQDRLERQLKLIFPGCRLFKMDQHQGVPDLLVLWNNKWAMLECKAYRAAHKQPNQDYWVDIYNRMSFARFVNPQNMEEVLHELQQAFRT